ncbi:UDP-N-acetylmuramate dehydrogenase [Clostridium perfringens]
MKNVNYKEFVNKYSEKIKFNENLSKYHTFKIDGMADIVASPSSKEELANMIATCKKNNYKYNIIGNGSNVIFENGEYNGILIITKKINNVSISENIITCGCGASVPLVAIRALNSSLSGMEKLSGIPGTIGGAIRMNAGAYGCEFKDILKEITILTNENEIKKVSPEELELGYRYSNVKKNKYIILECVLELKHGEYDDIKNIMDTCKSKRLTTQPFEYPNAGSIFKKEGEFFAGKVIDELGLKGYSIGGAMVSEKHANFIVNIDNAKSCDITNLINYIKDAVLKAYNITLHTEVEFL